MSIPQVSRESMVKLRNIYVSHSFRSIGQKPRSPADIMVVLACFYPTQIGNFPVMRLFVNFLQYDFDSKSDGQ